MTADQSNRWMSTWGGPCDCGACPAPGIAFQTAGNVSESEEIVPQSTREEIRYNIESWTVTDSGQNMTVAHVPLFDDEPFCRHHAEPLLLSGSDFIALAKSSGGKIYVHCEKGCSRSAAVVTCYLMKYEGMSLLEAAATLKSKRARVSPNGALVDVLSRIEKSLVATPSDLDAVNAAFRKQWLPDYRAGRIRLNNVDLIM